ncbi:MAG: hypothetical protein OHK0046_36010 [Anaerolineae bacterium]
MRKILLFVVLCLFTLMPAAAQTTPTIAQIVSDRAQGADAEFTVLQAALQAADPIFRTVLSDPDVDVTVFAPTDAAFQELLEALGATPESLLRDTLLVNDLLSYHVVPGLLPAQSLAQMNGTSLGTLLDGELLRVSVNGEEIFINASQVVTVDLFAANGVVHVIDTVLATEPDVEFRPTGTLADVVIANANDSSPEFSVLLAAAQAADPSILSKLTGGLPYTVFAPTDAAFTDALNELGVTAEQLLADSERLNAILEYHIVPGELNFDDLFQLYLDATGTPKLATLLSGVTLDVVLQNNGIALNYANIILPDVRATNGVIHVIDAVLIPPQ